MNLRTKRVSWGNIAITVREETGLDTFHEPHLFWRIVKAVHGESIDHSSQLEPYDNLHINSLSVMINRTTEITGDLGIVWPKVDSSEAELKDAYLSFDKLAGGLVRKWREAIAEISIEPMGDPDLAPPEFLDAKKKETET